MDNLMDKLCDLIVRAARNVNAVMTMLIGLVVAYFVVVFIVAMCL